MTYFLILLNLILVLVFCLIILLLSLKYFKITEEKAKDYSYLQKIINTITAVRYGNFQARVDDGYNEITEKLSHKLNDMFESISDRENMVQEYIAKEKETNVLKADFIATLTHDLKVPIIAQHNTFELFLNEKFGGLTELQKDVLGKLKASNMDLKYLVDALLETFKMEQAKIEVKKAKDINLADLINEVTRQLGSVLELHNKEINLINNISSEFCADIDVFLIKRVLQNLILNALFHSIYTKSVDVILNSENEAEFSIQVRDYGCGISKEEIEKIFKKYYSGSSKFGKSGIGLGLYLSNKIVNLHGGKIEVESEENKGTTFKIILNIN